MINNSINCQELFANCSDFFKKLLHSYQYPWEIIPHISEIALRIISEGLGSYRLLTNGVLVGKDVKISPTAEISGPAIIGHGTEVRHGAYIRGSVIIGCGCVIGNSSEVKNSILMDGVEVPHYNYIGDSILGTRAHLGASAICSNLRSDRQNVTIRSGNDKIETGIRKLGAILGDGVEIGCGAVLCPGTVIGRESVVYPLTLVRGTYPEHVIIKQDNSVIKRIMPSQ